MDNGNTNPPTNTRILILAPKKPEKPALTEADVASASLGGLFTGMILGGLGVGLVMAISHDREVDDLRDRIHDLKSQNRKLQADADTLFAKVDRILDSKGNGGLHSVT